MTDQELVENYIKIRDAAFVYEKEIRNLKEQIESLKLELRYSEQTKGSLCENCGWSMKFPEELCRCELMEENENLKKEIELLKNKYL